jgi:hypothetical protein
VRELAARLARVSLFAGLVAAGLQLAAARLVSAGTDRALLDLGAGLARLSETGSRDGGGGRALELNGLRLRFATGTQAEGVADVLDGAERACTEAGDARFLRGRDGERGFVACLARLDAEERAALGETAAGCAGYRYVYAQAGAERTQVVRLWTDRPLELERLFPDQGDAPGRDAPGMPRPPGARRVLSAREIGAAQELTIYAGPRAATDELETWYRARLAGLGWRALDPASRRAAPGPRVLVVGRGGALAALVFADEGGGAERTVAVLTSL